MASEVPVEQQNQNNHIHLVVAVYEWLRSVVPSASFNSVPSIDVSQKYDIFYDRLGNIRGSGQNGKPTHDETRELMYQICSESRWWDWRNIKAGLPAFPPQIPLAWK